MDVKLRPQVIFNALTFNITGSKSETNRLLLLKALYPEINLKNTSISDDSEVMLQALSSLDKIIDIHHAGTAMRFLTAFFAILENREVILTGSLRMKERPIKILVDALQQLGADIQYLENEGFPPLRIKGKKLPGNKVSLHANVSSQYISALLLIAPKMQNGLTLELVGDITSRPYINMTLDLVRELGVETSFIGNVIVVFPGREHPAPRTLTVESDWSSASYFYSIIAMASAGTSVTLKTYKQNSLQGDAAIASIYRDFGVDTVYSESSITLIKRECEPKMQFLSLENTPDIAQTIAVTCFGLGIGCELAGLHTLKIKETDRLHALKTELEKLGASVSITADSLTLKPSDRIKEDVNIETYNDHRMAMAFAPLAVNVPITIRDAEVVSKSYPDFWKDFETMGFNVLKMM
ncbi:MAG: 3-phosphoshikimate 1-carboxyvinyltransferase [Flavobacterium sp. BFFFF1]|uniref:3-phosphoshikimate 1-carboxyvinyltransferase n=1 Tax=Flavobacterium sp. BFFFF1 TaxID=2015557 RepID=UPI000BD8F998|nr:3-phosphoshikimate 1-carboxyvinyltransferase [Flavobacterium sp. BFFFF1]OYU79793.1 MAG: 3-phosphoshikimate 1-carboxyvinyltransferase [Flavobacterium sp. BFFFF1]